MHVPHEDLPSILKGAQEGRIVVLVHQQPQPGAEVLDLGALEVALAAGHLVRNLRRAQLLLEHAGLVVGDIPPLAFAVGVYLPISSSTPILVGGWVRWLVDRKLRKDLAEHNLTEEQFAAEADKPALLGGTPVHTGGWPNWPEWHESWEPEILKVLRGRDSAEVHYHVRFPGRTLQVPENALAPLDNEDELRGRDDPL